jgi:hypothetical protein
MKLPRSRTQALLSLQFCFTRAPDFRSSAGDETFGYDTQAPDLLLWIRDLLRSSKGNNMAVVHGMIEG